MDRRLQSQVVGIGQIEAENITDFIDVIDFHVMSLDQIGRENSKNILIHPCRQMHKVILDIKRL